MVKNFLKAISGQVVSKTSVCAEDQTMHIDVSIMGMPFYDATTDIGPLCTALTAPLLARIEQLEARLEQLDPS